VSKQGCWTEAERNAAPREPAKRCGNCVKWMKKPDCPRERGVMNGGPTANDPPCDQYLCPSIRKEKP
jgi:hypothetical protein